MSLCVSKKYESGKMNCFIEQLFMDVKEMSYFSIDHFSLNNLFFLLVYLLAYLLFHFCCFS